MTSHVKFIGCSRKTFESSFSCAPGDDDVRTLLPRIVVKGFYSTCANSGAMYKDLQSSLDVQTRIAGAEMNVL